MVNNVIFEMNCRLLLPTNDYDISVGEKKNQVSRQKRNGNLNPPPPPKKKKKFSAINQGKQRKSSVCQKKQLVKKKRANLNQSKCGKKKKYTLKEIAKIYPLFNPTQAGGGGGGAKVSAPDSSLAS